MTKIADANDVATHFEQWLKEVSAGNEVVVTQNDKPVAKVVAATNNDEADSQQIRVDQFPTLPGKWIGEDNIRHGDIADERYDRP